MGWSRASLGWSLSSSGSPQTQGQPRPCSGPGLGLQPTHSQPLFSPRGLGAWGFLVLRLRSRASFTPRNCFDRNFRKSWTGSPVAAPPRSPSGMLQGQASGVVGSDGDSRCPFTAGMPHACRAAAARVSRVQPGSATGADVDLSEALPVTHLTPRGQPLQPTSPSTRLAGTRHCDSTLLCFLCGRLHHEERKGPASSGTDPRCTQCSNYPG